MGDVYWYPSKGGTPNEEGWASPDAERGEFRPDLDRELTDCKVGCILMDLHMAKIVYVSNGSMGDAIGVDVAKECHEANRFDTEFIVGRLAHHLGGDGKFWQEKAAEWLLARGKGGGG